MSVDVVVCAHNEAAHLADVLDAITGAPSLGNLVVVVDSSVDGTALIARARRGVQIIVGDFADKGSAMAAGLRCVDSELVAFCDADLEGLEAGHVEALLTLEPLDGQLVAEPENDVAPGWLPSISGERRLPATVARGAGLTEAGWKAETRLNAAVAAAGLPWRHVKMRGVRNPFSWHPVSWWRVPVALVTYAPELARYLTHQRGSLPSAPSRV